MKIEIGESLVYSWLRHIKKCQIVQTNWKPSPTWEKHKIDLGPIKKDIEYEFADTNLDIFHKNNSIDQLLKQAEIDVVGIAHFSECNERKYHFVDVAYHEGGLNYGSADVTISRVLEKFIRSYFIYLQYFYDHSTAGFFFITPKMSKKTILNPLLEKIARLEKVFKRHELSPDFELLVNEEFNQSVLVPVLDISSKIADTNELFLRSAHLWKMFVDETTPTKAEEILAQQKQIEMFLHPIEDQKRIGKHVKECLEILIKKRLITSVITESLLSKDYSKNTFNLNFPFLRTIDQGRLDEKDYPRYYASEWRINDTRFYFCSQWVEPQRLQFDNWYHNLLEQK